MSDEKRGIVAGPEIVKMAREALRAVEYAGDDGSMCPWCEVEVDCIHEDPCGHSRDVDAIRAALDRMKDMEADHTEALEAQSLLHDWCEKLASGEAIDPDGWVCCSGGGSGSLDICGCQGQTYRDLARAVLAETEGGGSVDHAGRPQNPDDPNDPYLGGAPDLYEQVHPEGSQFYHRRHLCIRGRARQMTDQTSDLVKRAREALELLRPYNPDERRDIAAALDRLEALEKESERLWTFVRDVADHHEVSDEGNADALRDFRAQARHMTRLDPDRESQEEGQTDG